MLFKGQWTKHAQISLSMLTREKKGGEIECLCIACENGLIVRFHDYGVPFDPQKIPSPDLHTDLAERPVGGLGLYFMRRLMDEVSFEFSPTSIGNTVTMVKYNDRHFQIDIWPQIIALAEQLMITAYSCRTMLLYPGCDGKVIYRASYLVVAACLGKSQRDCSHAKNSYQNPPNDIMSQAFITKRGTYHDTTFHTFICQANDTR